MNCDKCGKPKEQCVCKKKNQMMMIIIIAAAVLVLGVGVYVVVNQWFGKDVAGFSPNEDDDNSGKVNDQFKDVNDTWKDEENQNNQSNENNQNNNEVVETPEDITMKCYKTTELGYEENYFYFHYVNEGYYINKYVIRFTIPTQYNVNDYYVEEEIANSGRYKMSLEGNVIVKELDSSMAFWNSEGFRYKDIVYIYLNKEFVEDGYTCE